MLQDYGLHQKVISDTEFEIFEEEVKLLYYHYEPENHLVYAAWHEYATEDQIVAMYKFMSWYAYQHKYLIVRSITDLTHFDGSFAGIGEWFFTEYIPMAIKHGLRASANVKPKDFFAQLALDEIEEMAGNIYEHQVFETLEEAYQWITTLQFDEVEEGQVYKKH